ncbi:MAG: hypothetical protein C0417_12670 [Chlorobiaceae bacterium]|nr:hypothetical protein [Chlorobiaceae bacterium]
MIGNIVKIGIIGIIGKIVMIVMIVIIGMILILNAQAQPTKNAIPIRAIKPGIDSKQSKRM